MRRANSSGATPRLALDQHERDHPAVGRHEQGGLAVTGVDDRLGLKCLRGAEDADDHGPAVVHLQHLAGVERLAGPHVMEAGLVHDDGVGLLQVAQPADDHVVGGPGQAGVVHAEQVDRLEVAVGRAGPRPALVKIDGPGDTRHAADAVNIVVGDGLDVVDVADAGVHDPDVGPGGVADAAGGPEHDAAEGGALLGDQQRGEGRCRRGWPGTCPGRQSAS